MRRILAHLLTHKTRYRRFAPFVVVTFLFMGTLLIGLTGGIPNAFADTIYIPVLIAAFYFGPLTAMVTGLVGGLLAGPFMMLGLFDAHTEPLLNSLYRTLYFVILGGVVGTLFTYLQKRNTRYHIQTEELEATLMSIGDGVVITDRNGIIGKVNPRACVLLGLEEDAILGRPFLEIFDMVNQETKEQTPDPIGAVLSGGIGVELEHHAVLKNHKGASLYIEDSASPIRSPEGELIGAILVFRDISERKAKEQRIMHISYHDHLTGLPNRRFFQERLEALDFKENYPLALIMMDLNALKVINDAYGHEKGDEALKHAANALDAIKPDRAFVARIGGDEFVMIVPNTDETDMQSIQDSLESRIGRKTIGGVKITLASGYAFKETPETVIRKVIRKAENRMYKNKVLSSKSTRNEAIMSILTTLTDKFEEEKTHSGRVAHFCELMGTALNLRPGEIKELRLAGQLHDIGKITVPDNILKKPGPLTSDEWKAMTRHTVNGYQILRAADKYSGLAEYAMSHHERMDGKGYPHQLDGEAIPLFARIISVADAFEAMTSARPYKEAMSEQEAIGELRRHSGTQFDPALITLFIDDVYPRIRSDNAV